MYYREVFLKGVDDILNFKPAEGIYFAVWKYVHPMADFSVHKDLITNFLHSLSVLSVIEGTSIPNEISSCFDMVIPSDSAEEYFSSLLNDRTEEQISAIANCLCTLRSGSVDAAFSAESAAFFRLISSAEIPDFKAPDILDDGNISVDLIDNIIYFCMDFPGSNLMTEQFFAAYEKAMQKCIDMSVSKKCPAGMIIYSGQHHFSIGTDIPSLVKRSISADGSIPQAHILQKKSFAAPAYFSFPVVAVINGMCIGSGSETAIHANFRVCEKRATIGQPETTFGLIPALGGVVRTAQICGIQNACEIVFPGSLFPASKALAYGWADAAVEKGMGIKKAKEIISQYYQGDNK